MKTKIIPFDLEMAEKIQAGEIEGKIMCHYGTGYKQVRIICWDRIPSYPIVGLVKIGQYFESVFFFDKNGNTAANENLVFEVPDNEPQFKPFDRVLVRNVSSEWQPKLYSQTCILDDGTYNDGYMTIDEKRYRYCIPYEGNEYLVGTTDKPKEE